MNFKIIAILLSCGVLSSNATYAMEPDPETQQEIVGAKYSIFLLKRDKAEREEKIRAAEEYEDLLRKLYPEQQENVEAKNSIFLLKQDKAMIEEKIRVAKAYKDWLRTVSRQEKEKKEAIHQKYEDFLKTL